MLQYFLNIYLMFFYLFYILLVCSIVCSLLYLFVLMFVLYCVILCIRIMNNFQMTVVFVAIFENLEMKKWEVVIFNFCFSFLSYSYLLYNLFFSDFV